MPITVEVSLRRADDGLDRDLGKVSEKIEAEGTATVPVLLPRLRAGDYYLNVFVKRAQGVEASAISRPRQGRPGRRAACLKSPWSSIGPYRDRASPSN